MQLAKGGRRILWLAHESAPKNFTGVDVTDPKSPKVIVQTDLPHKQVRSNSLEVCGDIMAVAYQTAKPGLKPGRHRAVRHLQAGNPANRSPCSTAPARNRAACISSGSSTARHPLLGRRGRLPAAQPAGRPVLSHHRRQGPGQAARDGPLVDARHARGRCRAAAAAPPRTSTGLPRPQHQRLSRPARPRLHGLHRRRRLRAGHRRHVASRRSALEPAPALPRLHAHGAAAVRPRPVVVSDECVQGQRRRLAQAGVGAGHARARTIRCRSHLPLPAVEEHSSAAAATARTTAREPPRPGLPLGSADLRHLFQRRRARARHQRSVPAEGDRLLRPGGAEGLAGRRHPDQRRLCRRERDRLCRRPLQPAGFTCWKPIFSRF